MLIQDPATQRGMNVDSEGRGTTFSTIETALRHVSEYDNLAFAITTPFLTVTAAGGRILWFQMTRSGFHLHIAKIFVHWNGGSTTFIRSLFIELYGGDTQPTTNTTVGAPVQLNSEAAYNGVDAFSIRYWDEVGNGMTGHTPGNLVNSLIGAQGKSEWDSDEALILGFNNTLSFNLQGDGEAGEASIVVVGYFENS